MNSHSSLSGKTAIVTGGSRGIGACIAKLLAKCGTKVLITYRVGESKAAEVVKAIKADGGQIAMLQADALDAESPKKIIQACLDTFGEGIDIIVHNAGVEAGVVLEDMDHEVWDRLMITNARFPVFLTQAALPHLRPKGSVVMVSSGAATMQYSGITAYSASKAAMEAITRTWSVELYKKYRCTCKAIRPGAVNTDMTSPYMENNPNHLDIAEPEEVADIVAFLCDESSYLLNGSVLIADKDAFVGNKLI